MAFCGLLITTATGQDVSKVNADKVLANLIKIQDQYGNNFNLKDTGDNLKLICVEGYQGVGGEIFFKFKGKKLDKNVRIVAGWKEVMSVMKDNKRKYDHLADAYKTDENLGKEGYSIFFDMNSETIKMLKLKKYSVVTVNKKKNRVEIENFDSDRIEFIKAIRKFFN